MVPEPNWIGALVRTARWIDFSIRNACRCDAAVKESARRQHDCQSGPRRLCRLLRVNTFCKQHGYAIGKRADRSRHRRPMSGGNGLKTRQMNRACAVDDRSDAHRWSRSLQTGDYSAEPGRMGVNHWPVRGSCRVGDGDGVECGRCLTRPYGLEGRLAVRGAVFWL